MLCTAVAGVGGRRLGWLCGAWVAKPTLHCTPWGPWQPLVNSRFPGHAQARLGTPGVAKRTRSRRESRLVVTILAAAQAAGSLFGFGTALPRPHSNACLPNATDTSTASLPAVCLHGPRFSCAGRTARVLRAPIITIARPWKAASLPSDSSGISAISCCFGVSAAMMESWAAWGLIHLWRTAAGDDGSAVSGKRPAGGCGDQGSGGHSLKCPSRCVE